jgi:mono/diheme cytochrome c family protein
MRRAVKWLGIGLGSLAGLAVLATAAVYGISEWSINKRYDAPLSTIAVPTDPASISRGQRLATVYGCNNSCHGKNMEGLEMYDEPGIAKINAPNLPQVLREYSDPELERLIRRGVKRDGTSTWIMPAPMYSHLSDEDLGAIIAFVRTAPMSDGPMREVKIRSLGRVGIVIGKFKPLATQVAPNLVPVAAVDRSNAMVLGQYLVKTACTECHGADLQGSEIVHAPSLAVSASYSNADFDRLLRSGVAIGGRLVGLMSEVGQTRFPALTDAEVAAVREYLRTQFPPTPEALARSIEQSKTAPVTHFVDAAPSS